MASRILKSRGQAKSLVQNIGWGPYLIRVDHKEFRCIVKVVQSTKFKRFEKGVRLIECGSKMQIVIYVGGIAPFRHCFALDK